jgi:hypothetical protein
MVNRFERSPHGYAYLTGSPFPSQGQAIVFNNDFTYDPVIETLWQRYIKLVGNRAPIDLVLLLVERLKQLFGDFKQWLWINVTTNKAIHGYSIDFLKDTINYSITGKRRYSVTTWEQVVVKKPGVGPVDAQSRIEEFNEIHIPNTTDLLTNWLKHKDGVCDMFYTAHILFGK